VTSHKWWNSALVGVKDIQCVYCGEPTSAVKENLEHVIPEALGCKETLYRGAVCNKCNQRLGENVDSKIFQEPLFAVGQLATNTPGKKGSRDEIGKHVRRHKDGSVSATGESGIKNQYFASRAITKCAVNILTQKFGSSVVRKESSDMISYVRSPKTKEDIWPFAALYSLTAKISVSYWLRKINFEKDEVLVVLFSCPSGLFAVPSKNELKDLPKALMELINDEVRMKETGKGIKLENTAEFFAQEQ
tara:strand:+ start:991 stop:1731 length:741 start_codon:yes stop_codon:yes gene_type:complete